MVPLIMGTIVMLISYLIPSDKQFSYRWVFGSGVFLFLFAIGIISTAYRQHLSKYDFSGIHETYYGFVTDIPQDKPNTVAYKVKTGGSEKHIVCYIPKEEQQKQLEVGEGLVFFSKIEPFNRVSNKDEFDYGRYMYNKGYSGYTFINSDKWEKTEQNISGLYIKAVQCRQYILNVYRTLDLTPDEFAMLSALTLGYKDALSDELVRSFRTTGTAHILAVSGMHVGIIYLAILFLTGFIPRHSRYFWVKQVCIIIFLWMYAFVAGLPPSAIRACIMLTAVCIAEMTRMKAYTINTLCAAAFLMLLWNPFLFFDLGFQLSFTAVFSMLLMLPVLSKYVFSGNKYIRYFINILLVSLAAQMGTFPLCLYYFGAFPTYFFLTNLLIIPLISLAFYTALIIGSVSVVGTLIPQISSAIAFLPVMLYKKLIQLVTYITHFFETLPFSEISDIKIPVIAVFVIWIFTFSFFHFIDLKKPRAFIASLGCVWVLCCLSVFSKIQSKNTLNIYNKIKSTHVSCYVGYNRFDITDVSENCLFKLNNLNYYIIKDDEVWKENKGGQKYDIDYLHIVGDRPLSLYTLNNELNIKNIILDGSLSAKNLKRLIGECEKLRIPYYDISANGVLRIFF